MIGYIHQGENTTQVVGTFDEINAKANAALRENPLTFVTYDMEEA